MSEINRVVNVLVGEDDPDDRRILKKAFGSRRRAVRLVFAEDGVEVLDYLKRRGVYTHPDVTPRPDMVILDLNFPRKNGKAVLEEIRQSKGLSNLPVLILTGSKADKDLMETFNLRVHSYLEEPLAYKGWLELVEHLDSFWVA